MKKSLYIHNFPPVQACTSRFFYKLSLGVFAAAALLPAVPSAMAQSYTWTTIAGLASAASGTNDGTGSAARFSSPLGVAVASDGNAYVADSVNNTVRELSPSGTNWVSSTVAGNGLAENNDGTGTKTASIYYPAGIVAASPQKLYVVSYNPTIPGYGRLRMLAYSAGAWQVSTPPVLPYLEGEGEFTEPSAVALDAAGNAYVTASDDNTLDMVSQQGQNWKNATVAGDGNGRSSGFADGTNFVSRFNGPCGVGVDGSGNIYVADTVNDTIREVSPVALTTNWITTTIAGHVGLSGLVDGTNTASYFSNPDAVAVDASGNLYIADGGNNAVRKITPQGGNWVVSTIGGLANSGSGAADGFGQSASFNHPGGIAVDGQGRIFVADTGNNTIRLGTPTAPATNTPAILQLATGGGGASVIWPTSASGFVLETSTSGAAGPWTAVTNGITANYVFTGTMTNAMKLFRLRQQ